MQNKHIQLQTVVTVHEQELRGGRWIWACCVVLPDLQPLTSGKPCVTNLTQNMLHLNILSKCGRYHAITYLFKLIKLHLRWLQYLNATSVVHYDVLNSNPDSIQHQLGCQAPLHPALPLKDVKEAHNAPKKESSTSFHSIYRLLFKGAVMNEYVWDGRCVDTLMVIYLQPLVIMINWVFTVCLRNHEQDAAVCSPPIQPRIMCLHLNDISRVCGRKQLK